MSFVLIRHKVANYARWKKAVRSFRAYRKASGEKCFKVFRDSSSPNDVTVLCRWSTPAKLRKFVKSAELRKAMKEAGVISKPVMQFFSGVEDLSVD